MGSHYSFNRIIMMLMLLQQYRNPIPQALSLSHSFSICPESKKGKMKTKDDNHTIDLVEKNQKEMGYWPIA